MTIRERIADWLTGGKLAERRVGTLIKDGETLLVERGTLFQDNMNLVTALRQIAALETPKANATVRKMARIAREASHG